MNGTQVRHHAFLTALILFLGFALSATTPRAVAAEEKAGANGANAAAPPAADWDMKRPDNTPPEGFTAEFNGKDLANWKGLVSPGGGPPARAKMTPEQLKAAQEKADERMRQHWKVEDGTLVYDGHGDSLCTAKDYGDFEMWVDWKIEPKGDSGIYLRGSPQVQIWDAGNPNEVKNGAEKGSGGLFNNKKPENPHDPLVRADNPVGQWNRFFIRMVGEKVWVWLNGKLVVEGVTLENYWERNTPIYPAGQIELQNHNSHLWFKNVYIKELPRGGEEKAKG